MASSALCASVQPWQRCGGAGERQSISPVPEAPSGQCCRHTAPRLTCPIAQQPVSVQAQATMLELFSLSPALDASAFKFTPSFSGENRVETQS